MSDTRGRPRQQSRQKSHGRIHPAVWSLLGLGLCLALLGAAVSGVFKVREVSVVGANVPSDAVIAASGVLGQNIFTVQSDQVVSRVSRVREIAVRRVETDFPDRVTIYALARRAMVAWRPSKALYELDPEGRVIRQVTTTSLPVILGSDSRGAPSYS